MKISIKRLNDAVHMEAVNEDNVTIHMDGTETIGGINGGFRPMQMLLAAAGGCSAIDVIGILKKQRQNPDELTIDVTGDRVSVGDHSEFKSIHIHFMLKGSHLDEKKVARAINLSLTKYCSVSKHWKKHQKLQAVLRLFRRKK